MGIPRFGLPQTALLPYPDASLARNDDDVRCETDKILFSGDAFGCFGALNGNYHRHADGHDDYWPEMERYYAAILGKFGSSVQAGLKKLGDLISV